MKHEEIRTKRILNTYLETGQIDREQVDWLMESAKLYKRAMQQLNNKSHQHREFKEEQNRIIHKLRLEIKQMKEENTEFWSLYDRFQDKIAEKLKLKDQVLELQQENDLLKEAVVSWSELYYTLEEQAAVWREESGN